VSDRTFELFDEYAVAYVRGERPEADEYLARAGDERDQLVSLLDEFLRRSPVPSPTEDERRLLGLMLAEEPPSVITRRARQG
jgi:hypothetical protein